MPRSSGKKKTRAARKRATQINPPLNPLDTGMPALDSITDVKEFKVGRKVYRIIETNETDAYDKPLTPKRKRRSGR
ncbi:MAG: hypothetical protein V7641_3244 [Blastocatellia bacterium]